MTLTEQKARARCPLRGTGEFECVFVQHPPSSLSFIHKHHLLFSISISIPFLSFSSSILRCHRYCRLWYSVIKANEQRIHFFCVRNPKSHYYSSIPQVLIQGSQRNGSHSSSRRPTSERQFSIKFGELACERPSPSARAISFTSPFKERIKFYRLESRIRSDRKCLTLSGNDLVGTFLYCIEG